MVCCRRLGRPTLKCSTIVTGCGDAYGVFVVCTAGVVFGWSALVPVLEREGTFRDQCSAEDVAEEGNAVSCDARTKRLATVFIIGSFAALTGPAVTGFVNDWLGPRCTTVLAAVLAWIGWSLNAAALASHTHAPLLFGGFFFLGIAAVTFLFPVLSVSNLFPGSEALIICCLCGLFDVAAVIFEIFAALYHSAGVDLLHILAGYMAGPLVVSFLFGLLLWPGQPFSAEQGAGEHDSSSIDERTARMTGRNSRGINQTLLGQSSSFMDDDDGHVEVEMCDLQRHRHKDATLDVEEESPHRMRAGGSVEDRSTLLPVDEDKECWMVDDHALVTDQAATDLSPAREGDESPDVTGHHDAAELAFGSGDSPYIGLSALDQMKTREYLLYVAFESIHIFRFAWMLTAAAGHLEHLSRGSESSPSPEHYLSLLAIVLPVGALVVVPAGVLMDRVGVEAGLFALCVAGIAVSTAALIPMMRVQLVTFCLTGVARSLTFATMGAYLPVRFGLRTMGTLFGVAEGVGGLLVALQFPALAAALRFGFHYVNGALLLLGILQLLFPLYLLRKRRSESRFTPRSAQLKA